MHIIPPPQAQQYLSTHAIRIADAEYVNLTEYSGFALFLLQEYMQYFETTNDRSSGLSSQKTRQLLFGRDTLNHLAKKFRKELEGYNKEIQAFQIRMKPRQARIDDLNRRYGHHLQRVMDNATNYFESLGPYFHRTTKNRKVEDKDRDPLNNLIDQCTDHLKTVARQQRRPAEDRNESFLTLREEAFEIFEQEWKRLKHGYKGREKGKRLPHKLPLPEYTKREQIALKAPPALHRWLYRQDRQGRRNQQGSYEQDRRSEGGNRKPLDQDGVRAYRRDYSPEDDPPDRIPSHYQRDVSQRRGAYHPRHGGVDPHWSGHYQYNDPISAQEDPDPDPRIGERRQGRGYPFEGDSLEAQLGGRNRSPGRNFNVQYQQHDSALNGNPAANAPGDGGIRHPDHVTPPRNRRSDSPTETEEVPEAIPGREHRPRNPDDWTRRTPRSRLARAPPGTPSNRQNGPGES